MEIHDGLRGDLGKPQIPVCRWKLYMERFPKTLELAVAGLILGVGIVIPLDILPPNMPNDMDNLINTTLFLHNAASRLGLVVDLVFVPIENVPGGV